LYSKNRAGLVNEVMTSQVNSLVVELAHFCWVQPCIQQQETIDVVELWLINVKLRHIKVPQSSETFPQS